MHFTPDLLPSLPLDHTNAAANRSTFDWLLILGFPPEIAAAKAMPELFAVTQTRHLQLTGEASA